MAASSEEKLLIEFKEQILYRFGENTKRISICMDNLSETEVWYSPNESSNSAGTLILHLCGNITQYIISGLGGEPDIRERDKEFKGLHEYIKERLTEKLKSVTDKASGIILNTGYEQLIKLYSIQGYLISGIAALVHVTEHYSYHTGQITMLTKIQKNTDVGFYSGLDLNRKNRE